MQRQKQITIIGLNYLEPITTLTKKLSSLKFSGESKVQVSPRENGYAVSIILLTAVTIESLVNRMRYLEKDKSKQKNLIFLQNFLSADSKLFLQINEIMIARDIIAHNHVRLISYDFDDNYDEIKIYNKLLNQYGDPKFKDNINKKTKKTKLLKLNIIPTKIGISDVLIAYNVFINFIDLLNKKKANNIPMPKYLRDNLSEAMKKLKNPPI